MKRQISKKTSQKVIPKKTKKARFSLMGNVRKGPELKVVDVNDGGGPPVVTLLNSTGSLTLLNGMDLGAGPFQRVGRTVQLKSLHVRGSIFPSLQTGTNAGEHVRILVVYDRQTNGALPSPIDVIQSIDANGNGSSSTFDYPNLTFSDRFIILADHAVALSDTSSGVAHSTIAALSKEERIFDRYIDVTGLPTLFKGDTDAIASIASGSLFVLAYGSQAFLTAGATFNWCSRLRYFDA